MKIETKLINKTDDGSRSRFEVRVNHKLQGFIQAVHGTKEVNGRVVQTFQHWCVEGDDTKTFDNSHDAVEELCRRNGRVLKKKKDKK